MATFPELVCALRRGDADADAAWLEFFEPTINYHVRRAARASRDDARSEAVLACLAMARQIATGAHRHKPAAGPDYTGDFSDVVTQTLVSQHIYWRVRDAATGDRLGGKRKGDSRRVTIVCVDALETIGDSNSVGAVDLLDELQACCSTDAERDAVRKVMREENLTESELKLLQRLGGCLFARLSALGDPLANRIPKRFRKPKPSTHPRTVTTPDRGIAPTARGALTMTLAV